jgi:hypothetical protein
MRRCHVDNALPPNVHRCRDCFFDLQARAEQALKRCPQWGKNREYTVVECKVFMPRLDEQQRAAS